MEEAKHHLNCQMSLRKEVHEQLNRVSAKLDGGGAPSAAAGSKVWVRCIEEIRIHTLANNRARYFIILLYHIIAYYYILKPAAQYAL